MLFVLGGETHALVCISGLYSMIKRVCVCVCVCVCVYADWFLTGMCTER